jgi:A/G-specific adenine glycosylase
MTMPNDIPVARAIRDRPAAILAWYDQHRRSMPWRALPGDTPNPYHVWLSEIMLQQTTVATVGAYFRRFIGRWPDMKALAAADLDDVLHAWQGLGYYARARNLHRCAVAVAGTRDGILPDTEAELLTLPGIGRYTAAAIASIAFNRRATVVDGNVERVMARLYRVESPLPDAKPALYALAETLTPAERPGDYAQAVMDLGATVCTPRNPQCLICPWSNGCAGRDIAAELPRRAPKKARPLRRGIVFWLTNASGAVLLRRRPEKGLLGGMMEFPSTEWREGQSVDIGEARREIPLPAAEWRQLPGIVEHGFTHFRLELTVLTGAASGGAGNSMLWCPVDRLADLALPTLMKKVVHHVREADGDPR